MTKEELITKQQLEIEECKSFIENTEKIKRNLRMKLYAIGQPLNDNVLKMNKEQLKWCFEINTLVDEL